MSEFKIEFPSELGKQVFNMLPDKLREKIREILKSIDSVNEWSVTKICVGAGLKVEAVLFTRAGSFSEMCKPKKRVEIVLYESESSWVVDELKLSDYA